MYFKALYHEKWCRVAQDAVSYQPSIPSNPCGSSSLDDTAVNVLRQLGAGPKALKNLDALFSQVAPQRCVGESKSTYLESLRTFIEDKIETIPTVDVLGLSEVEHELPLPPVESPGDLIPAYPAEPVPSRAVSQRCECQCILWEESPN